MGISMCTGTYTRLVILIIATTELRALRMGLMGSYGIPMLANQMETLILCLRVPVMSITLTQLPILTLSSEVLQQVQLAMEMRTQANGLVINTLQALQIQWN